MRGTKQLSGENPGSDECQDFRNFNAATIVGIVIENDAWHEPMTKIHRRIN